MKNINYKRLRRFDIGKPVENNEFNLNNNDNSTVENIQMMQEGSNSENQYSLASKSYLASSLSSLTTLSLNALLAINAAKTVSTGASVAANSVSTAGSSAAAAGSTASSSLASLGSIAGYGAAAIGTATGIILGINAMKTYEYSDLDRMSSKQYQYVDGLKYLVNSGVDYSGILHAAAKLRTTNLLTSMANDTATGLGLGTSIYPGLGTAIGAAAGLIVGTTRGLILNAVAKKKLEKRLMNATIANEGANRQAFSEARTRAFNEKYNSTVTADKGLSPNYNAPNALVQGGEPIISVDKRTGSIKSAKVFPITKEHPERVDNIPVKLDQGDTTHGILGNKIDPNTGQRYSVEGRPYVEMLNKGNSYDKQIAKDNLRYLLDLQDSTPDVLYADQGKGLDKLTWVSDKKKQEYMTRANKQDMLRYAKSLPKFGIGKADWNSIVPGAIGATLSGLLALGYYKTKPEAYSSYAENKYADKALNMMPLRYDPTTQLNALNDVTRLSMYSINRSPYSAGQRMSMLSTLYGDRMKNKASILDNAEKITNQYKADYAKLATQIGESDAQRRQRSNELYNDQYAKAKATRLKGMETGLAGAMNNINSIFANLNNNYWTNKNIGLYEQKIKGDNLKLFNEITSNGKYKGDEESIKKILGLQ